MVASPWPELVRNRYAEQLQKLPYHILLGVAMDTEPYPVFSGLLIPSVVCMERKK